MAQSPAHRFGQLIGELLESVVLPQLDEFCRNEGLYLDSQVRMRPARRGKKVNWEDQYGNVHDLDFVIERDGSDHEIGRPIAFIESAWRRYTKHSRNKAQEIQGAILPLAEKYNWNNPFFGSRACRGFHRGIAEPDAISWFSCPALSVRVADRGLSVRGLRHFVRRRYARSDVRGNEQTDRKCAYGTDCQNTIASCELKPGIH